MLSIHNIMFARDFTPSSDAALPFALKLARQSGATLHSVFAEVVYGARFEHASEQAQADAERLQELPELDSAAAGAVEIKHAVVRGVSAAPALNEYAAEQQIDMIVMGTHGRRGIRRVLLGSVAEEVVRHAPCPVLTVRAGRDRKPAEVRRILVPMDFSQHSRSALLHASALAETFEAELLLLHVVHDRLHPAFYGVALQSVYDADPQVDEKALAQLEEEFARIGSAAPRAEYLVRAGVPASVILDVVDEKEVDLLVMGTHGLTGLERFFLGSVTEKVVRNAPCAVFTLKSFGKMLVDVPEGALP